MDPAAWLCFGSRNLHCLSMAALNPKETRASSALSVSLTGRESQLQSQSVQPSAAQRDTVTLPYPGAHWLIDACFSGRQAFGIALWFGREFLWGRQMAQQGLDTVTPQTQPPCNPCCLGPGPAHQCCLSGELDTAVSHAPSHFVGSNFSVSPGVQTGSQVSMETCCGPAFFLALVRWLL